jgi:hypothetical protein
MALTKSQRKLIRSAEEGFARATGLSPDNYQVYGRRSNYKKFGSLDLGAYRTVWFWEVRSDDRKLNMSISRYYRETGGAGVGSPKPIGGMRTLDFKLSDVRKPEMPIIRGHFDLEGPAALNPVSLQFAIDLTEEFKSYIHVGNQGKYIVSEVASHHKPREVSRSRIIGERATLVGVLPGSYSGIYFTIPANYLGGIERAMSKHLTDATKETLTKLLEVM